MGEVHDLLPVFTLVQDSKIGLISKKTHMGQSQKFPVPVNASSDSARSSLLSFCLCSWDLCLARAKLG